MHIFIIDTSHMYRTASRPDTEARCSATAGSGTPSPHWSRSDKATVLPAECETTSHVIPPSQSYTSALRQTCDRLGSRNADHSLCVGHDWLCSLSLNPRLLTYQLFIELVPLNGNGPRPLDSTRHIRAGNRSLVRQRDNCLDNLVLFRHHQQGLQHQQFL